MVSPWKTGFGNSTFSKPRLPTVVPRVVSPTESPTAMPSVSRLLTRGLPNSAFWAAWKSRWSGCGFMVRQVKKTLSDSVMVRPGWCWYVWPTSSSSNSLPAMRVLPRSRRASARRVQLRDQPDARVEAPEQALEVVTGRLVQRGARRPAAVLHQHAAETAIGRVPGGAFDAGVGGDTGEQQLVHPPRPQQALEARGVERAHGRLVEPGLVRLGGERVEDLVLAPPAGIAHRLRHRPHVRRQIAEVRQLRAHREVHDPQAAGPEEPEQPLDGGHHDRLDPVEARRALLGMALVLQQPAEALVTGGARVLHVHHHQGHPRGVEAKARVELAGVVRHAGAEISRPDGAGRRDRCGGRPTGRRPGCRADARAPRS